MDPYKALTDTLHEGPPGSTRTNRSGIMAGVSSGFEMQSRAPKMIFFPQQS